ncbi:SDR family NAD(P)-dependent oxidoreductase, partial [Escherichia coli]
SGMGLESARYLLREGARIVLTDLKEEGLRKAEAELASLGEVRSIAADLGDQAGADRLKAFADAAYGEKPTIL